MHLNVTIIFFIAVPKRARYYKYIHSTHQKETLLLELHVLEEDSDRRIAAYFSHESNYSSKYHVYSKKRLGIPQTYSVPSMVVALMADEAV